MLDDAVSIAGEAWTAFGSPPPVSVTVSITLDTSPPTHDSRVFSVNPDGSWSGHIPVGDHYVLSVLDVAGEIAPDAGLNARATINGDLHLAFSESVDDDPDNTFTLLPAESEMTIDGMVFPQLGEQPVYEMKFSLVSRSVIVYSETIRLFPNGSGAAAVQHTLPYFTDGGFCVAGLVTDTTGDPIEMNFTGSASVGLTTLPATNAPGGFVLFNCGNATDFGKKEVTVPGQAKKSLMAYLLKLGKFTQPPESNPNCFLCEWQSPGHDDGTDGFAPSRIPGSRPGSTRPNQKITAQTLLLCNGTSNAGYAGGGQTVAITCSQHHNFELKPAANVPPHAYTGVDYDFLAWEPPGGSTNGGKSVLQYKWFQAVKVTVSWTNADGTTGEHVDDWSWDAEPGASPPSYGGATASGTNGSGSVNRMHDAPGALVPRNDEEASDQFLNTTYGPNSNYTKLTWKFEFRTYLVCCTTDTVIASYKWDFTVCVKRSTAGGKTTFSSKVTEQNPPTEQASAQDGVFNSLIPEGETFPC